MRKCLLAALALIVSAAGCTTLKPSHREYKSTKSDAAIESQPPTQIQQVQYVDPAGSYAAQPAVQPAGQFLPGQTYDGYGACPGGNCPGDGGHPGLFGHQGPCGPRGHQKLFDGGRYGYFGAAHGTPGYPHHHFAREYVGPQGPPAAQTAYPYSPTRGPRDFLLDNPPSIGR
jgi:hypothetical protein